MSRKRRNTSSPEPDASPSPKRSRPTWADDFSDEFCHPVSNQQSKNDAVYGQKGAFPGLDDDASYPVYGDPSDGIEYLHMVRLEANSLPQLLSAPQAALNSDTLHPSDVDFKLTNVHSDFYDDDEAYVADPDNAAVIDDQAAVLSDAQQAYYSSLRSHFLLLRATLKCHPPLPAIQALRSTDLITLPAGSRKAQRQWQMHIQKGGPKMVQLACMDAESTLEVVKLLTSLMTPILHRRSLFEIRRYGAWVWGVLGRCRQREELGGEEIAVLRGLMDQAVKISNDLEEFYQKPDDESNDEQDVYVLKKGGNADKSESRKEMLDVDREVCSDRQELATDLEGAKARLQAKLFTDEVEEDESAEEGEEEEDEEEDEKEERAGRQIDTVLDTIITIVGELYGQRDLLEYREVWDVEDG